MPDSIAIIGFWDFQSPHGILKFIYSEKATKFCEIFPLLLTVCTVQNFVAFSEYMKFNIMRQTRSMIRNLVIQYSVFYCLGSSYLAGS